MTHLREMFIVLKRRKMMLNLIRYAFGVVLGKFLGFMVNQKAIKDNLEKIKVLFDMSLPQKPKEVQSLARRVAALSRFVS